jgi:PAS domain S-box-containing protein
LASASITLFVPIVWRAAWSIEHADAEKRVRAKERKAANGLLERQRRQMSQAQGIGQFGSWEWDISANTTEWSDELYRIYGLVPDGKPMSFEDIVALMHPDDRAAVQVRIQVAYESCEPFCFDHRIVRPDGEVLVLQARGEVITGGDGTPVRLLGPGQDITARHEIERTKDEFVSIVSHELRTPLTSIRGSLGLLAGGVLVASPGKAERMLQIALENTDRLVRLINDMLDIERMNSGKAEIERRPCDAERLAQDAADAMDAAAAQAGVTLHVSAGRAAVWADPDRVAQTLTNLLSNAIKFSPQGGGVWLGVDEREEELLFSVRDEGRGIPADKLEQVFERFRQVDSSDARDKGGTGLGLAICRSIVEQHGGRIWVESVAGRGSTFTFTLPAGLPEAVDGPEPAVASRPRILICDDDPAVREVTGALLEQQGYAVISAASGREAITLAKAESPSAILLDILMPGLSGWDTALALSQAPETREIPIVILSVLPAEQPASSPVAVADWIGKPVDEKTLFEALDRALARQRAIERVLVVEDDHDLASVLLTVFERHGVQAVQATSGMEAVELCRDLQPDLLVLDVGLPEGDGFWVVDWLRQHERMRNVPIVVYSARDLNAAERRRLDMGRTRFMTKGTVTLEQFERDVLDFVGAVAPRAEVMAGDY